jgi:hypothetical protein
MSTSTFSIGDAVTNTLHPKPGLVVMHDHERGLIRVRWESGVREWLAPSDLTHVHPKEEENE